jgi:hypothetical protein
MDSKPGRRPQEAIIAALPGGNSMSDKSLEIHPSTKVAQLLDAYPELEDVLIRMAPPFKKLKNPILRKSVAKVATLKQAAIAGGLDLSSMINQLREAIGQAPLDAMEAISEEQYLGTAPSWFDQSRVASSIDDRAGDSDEMAITRILTALRDLDARQVVELITTFLPAPGIDAARKKGLLTWSVRDEEKLYKTYFTRSS